MQFQKLAKPQKGDKVAILSPYFAAPGKWPHVYELGLKRIREVFELEPVEFPTTKKIGATKEERAKDLIDAFENTEIKAVIASLGGNDQVTYIKNLPKKIFTNNPKPFLGYSDNTHLINHLWQCKVPSFYGGHLFTEFAMQNQMDDFTIKYLKLALFEEGEFKLEASKEFNDEGLNWNDESTLNQKRRYQENEGWVWDGNNNAEGITWGGCLESLDEILRNGIEMPILKDFEEIVLFTETSEEIPKHEYVHRVFRAFGERRILERIKGLIIGRPKSWEFNNQKTDEEKVEYKKGQREAIIEIVRQYNKDIPIVQNFDIGHTAPQIPFPVGKLLKIDGKDKKVMVEF